MTKHSINVFFTSLTLMLALFLAGVLIVPSAFADESTSLATEQAVSEEQDAPELGTTESGDSDGESTPEGEDESTEPGSNGDVVEEIGALSETSPTTDANPEGTGDSTTTAPETNSEQPKPVVTQEPQPEPQPTSAIKQTTVVTIGSAASTGSNVDVPGISLKAGTAVKLWAVNATAAQHFRIVPLAKTEYSVVYNVASNLALSIAGTVRAGAPVQQLVYTGANSQKWLIVRNTDGSCTFYSACELANGTKLALDATAAAKAVGTNGLTVQKANGAKAQKFSLKETKSVDNGQYVLHSAMNANKALDVYSCSKAAGANVEIYDTNYTSAQVFSVVYENATGYYLLTNVNSGKRLEVAKNASNRGANVQQGNANSLWGQRWSIQSTGGDTFRLVNAQSNLSLDVSGASQRNCANVIQWNTLNQANQKWRFEQLAPLSDTVASGSASNLVKTTFVNGAGTYFFLPSYANLKALRLSDANGSAVYVSSKANGSFKKVSAATALDITGYGKNAAGYYQLFVKRSGSYYPTVVTVMKSASVRTVYLVSDDPVKKGRAYVEASADHSAKATGEITLMSPTGALVYAGDLTQIKGRGNSTWRCEKKPYQIKLAKKASLLDGTKENKAKTWVLLANAYDDTLMRNYISLKAAQAIGLTSSPDCEFVDLYYDGEYRGNYLLCEKVQVGDGRVEIDEIENTSTDSRDISTHATALSKNKYGMQFQYVTGVKQPKDITGGYLVELDNWYYTKERSWFRTSIGYFVLKTPEDASAQEVKYISERMQEAINEISKASGNAAKYFDLESLVKAHLVNEMAKNPDYLRASSTYFYLGKGNDVIHAGPVWDFDIAYGVHKTTDRSYQDPQGWATAGYAFYANNTQFKEKLKTVYSSVFLPQVKGLFGSNAASKLKSLTTTESTLKASVAMERMVNKTEKAYFLPVVMASWKSAANYNREWLAIRVNWMNSVIVGGKAPIAVMSSVKAGTYKIQSAFGKVLDIKSSSNKSGANAVIFAAKGKKSQKFKIVAVGTSATGETMYSIMNVKSKRYLSLNAKGQVVQSTKRAASAQRWVFRMNRYGTLSIVDAKTGKALDVANAKNANNAKTITWSQNGGTNQSWILKAA